MGQMVAGMVTCLAALRGPPHPPHHLALEVGVVARALPWGAGRGVDGLLHQHFQQLVVVEADDLVAEVLVAVLVAKDVPGLPSREAARHRGQLAGAEVVAALSDVGLEKVEVDGVVALLPPSWRKRPVATAFVLQGGAAERGAMASPLPKGSLCLHWLFKKLSPQNYDFFPIPCLFPKKCFGKPKIVLAFASSVLAKPLHNAQIVRGVFCLCPLAHGRSYMAVAKRHGFLGI